MINVLFFLFLFAALIYGGFKAIQLLMLAIFGDKPMYHCGCGCDKFFPASYGWDGYHGVGGKRYIPEEEKPKAIDYSPDSVLDWQDIQWTVEKRLPKE